MTTKKRLTFFDRLILWLNYAIVIALLIGYLAPVTDPRKVWIVAFFGLAYPPVLLANAIFIIYWLLRKSWWAFLSLTSILIGWNVLNNHIGFRLSSTINHAADTSSIRVMNYNVHDFNRSNVKLAMATRHNFLQVIAHQRPDIIGFEEFYTKMTGHFAMVDSIKQILPNSEVYYASFFPGINKTYTESLGMAVFSRLPIINKGVVWLNDEHSLNQCIYIDVKKAKQIFRVYIVHLQSIRFDHEDYRYIDSVSKKGKADISGSRRIGAKLKQAFIRRSEQVKNIKNNMATCPYPYIVIGDFNDTPSSYAVNQMSKGLKNAFREKGSGLGRTYNGDFPSYQIDYILASRQFNILTYGVIRKKLSDHYPIYSDLQLK